MNEFAPGIAGGGNLGFAVGSYTEARIRRGLRAKIRCSANVDPVQAFSATLLAKNALKMWQKVAQDGEHYEIDLALLCPMHVGLASSAAVQMCTLLGLNWLNGVPFSEECLRRELSRNYREVVNRRLTLGFTTGLSAVLNCLGGFAIVDVKGALIDHISVPQWSYVLATVAACGEKSFGANEAKVLLGEGRRLDKRDSRNKAAMVKQELIPAVREHSLKEIGTIVSTLQKLGSKKAEIGIYGTAAWQALDKVRKDGIECAFLSAVGPGIVLISQSTPKKAASIAKSSGLMVRGFGFLDSIGATIESGYRFKAN